MELNWLPLKIYCSGFKLDNSKLGSTQQQKICWHWHVARIISSQKIYGLYAPKHHIVELRGDVTNAGRTNKQSTKQTLKIELLSQWKLKADFRNYDHLVESGVGNKKDLLQPAFCYTLRYHHWKAIMFSVVRPGLSTWIWISQRSQLRPVGTCNRDS